MALCAFSAAYHHRAFILLSLVASDDTYAFVIPKSWAQIVCENICKCAAWLRCLRNNVDSRCLWFCCPNSEWCKHRSRSLSQKSGVVPDSFFYSQVSLEPLCVVLPHLPCLCHLYSVSLALWPLFLRLLEYRCSFSTLIRAVFPRCRSDLAMTTWPKCLNPGTHHPSPPMTHL